MGRKSGSKRQASLDARKQILKVKGDFLELSDDDDDDEVIEITEAPAKKYKVTARKSDGERNVLRIVRLDAEPTLDMEVWSDELSPAQLALRKNSLHAREVVQNVLDDYLKKTDGRVLSNSSSVTALELPTFLQNEIAKRGQTATVSTTSVNRPAIGRPAKRPVHATTMQQPAGFSLVLDTRATAMLSNTVSFSTSGLQVAANAAAKRVEAPVPKKKAFLKTYSAASAVTSTSTAPPLVPIIRTELPPSTQMPTLTSFQQVVDLTSDDNSKSAADTKEVSFNKLQGKTFPSLVVVARPSLRVSTEGMTEGRTSLDRKVKKILMLNPRGFVEHLIREGLIKSEHYCQTHPTNLLKLGIYSDAARFPFSGGYIWISECCPPKFLSVFHESIFEGNHPPTTNFKLIYHWACQTNVQNVLQWVKIENIYLKGLYTWLRGICTVALHTHLEPLGGKGHFVEVGVISLGTTTQDGANRHVKVEVLGVLEQNTRRIMLKAVDPNDLESGNKTGKKRLNKILEPLLEWVDTESTLVIDMTIEKTALQGIGFQSVIRNGPRNNQTIMDYLRRIVPRMFQNTLSLLSRQIIQQFLDELVWREIYGTNPHETFSNILKHISEQTRVDAGLSFFTRLNKVAANPFKNWSVTQYLKKNNSQKARKQPMMTLVTPRTVGITNNFPRVAQIPKQTTSLEPYYYGTVECNKQLKEVEINVQCPICTKIFTCNVDLLLHIFRHVSNADYFCKYCLMDCGSKHNLYTHLELKHATETKAGRFFNCLICHDKFNSVVVLGKHMAIEHSPSELPYHCGSCEYKSSSHKSIIDHFYKRHRNQGTLQCPFCLHVVDLHDAESLSNNVNKFIQHLMAHCKKGKNPKGPVKKCARCDLQFLSKEEFDAHGDRHVSHRHEPNFIPYPENKTYYMVPKSLRDEDLREPMDSAYSVTFNIDETYKCKECDRRISTESHFQNLMHCNKGDCKYQTLCRAAIASHKVMCSMSKKKIQEHPLDFELFCVCGFSNTDGNVMARHLSICERKSAYPTMEAASKASVTPGMLDVLGLVRRLEDNKEPEEPKKRFPLRDDTRRRKRKWRLSDVSGDEDADDPDYEISDEELRATFKKKKLDKPTTTASASKSQSDDNSSEELKPTPKEFYDEEKNADSPEIVEISTIASTDTVEDDVEEQQVEEVTEADNAEISEVTEDETNEKSEEVTEEDKPDIPVEADAAANVNMEELPEAESIANIANVIAEEGEAMDDT